MTSVRFVHCGCMGNAFFNFSAFSSTCVTNSDVIKSMFATGVYESPGGAVRDNQSGILALFSDELASTGEPRPGGAAIPAELLGLRPGCTAIPAELQERCTVGWRLIYL